MKNIFLLIIIPLMAYGMHNVQHIRKYIGPNYKTYCATLSNNDMLTATYYTGSCASIACHKYIRTKQNIEISMPICTTYAAHLKKLWKHNQIQQKQPSFNLQNSCNNA